MSATTGKCSLVSDTLRNEARVLEDAAKRVAGEMLTSMTAVREIRERVRFLEERETEAIRLINAAFGEYACVASKLLPEDERQKFETNFAVPAREFLRATKTED